MVFAETAAVRAITKITVAIVRDYRIGDSSICSNCSRCDYICHNSSDGDRNSNC